MNQTIDPQTTPDRQVADRLASIEALLFGMHDYSRRIHWWVQLIGWIWLIMLVAGAIFGFAAWQSAQHHQNASYCILHGC